MWWGWNTNLFHIEVSMWCVEAIALGNTEYIILWLPEAFHPVLGRADRQRAEEIIFKSQCNNVITVQEVYSLVWKTDAFALYQVQNRPLTRGRSSVPSSEWLAPIKKDYWVVLIPTLLWRQSPCRDMGTLSVRQIGCTRCIKLRGQHPESGTKNAPC